MAEQTGAPVPHAVVVDRRHQAVRTERDVNRRRIALAVIGVMLLAIASIVIAGYVLIFVLPSREVVVRVNDVTYTRGDMVKLLRVSQKGIEYLWAASSTPPTTFSRPFSSSSKTRLSPSPLPSLGYDRHRRGDTRRRYAAHSARAAPLPRRWHHGPQAGRARVQRTLSKGT